MIEAILPPTVAVATAYDDPAEAVLFPEEEVVVRRAVVKRYREFATVRWCARRAFAALAGLRRGQHDALRGISGSRDRLE